MFPVKGVMKLPRLVHSMLFVALGEYRFEKSRGHESEGLTLRTVIYVPEMK